jgi:hypothetical protein
MSDQDYQRLRALRLPVADEVKVRFLAIATGAGLELPHVLNPAHQTRGVVRARREMMSILRDEYDWTYKRIGRLFGMHHTTVLAGLKRFAREQEQAVGYSGSRCGKSLIVRLRDECLELREDLKLALELLEKEIATEPLVCIHCVREDLAFTGRHDPSCPCMRLIGRYRTVTL